jgi:hypothetical protein
MRLQLLAVLTVSTLTSTLPIFLPPIPNIIGSTLITRRDSPKPWPVEINKDIADGTRVTRDIFRTIRDEDPDGTRVTRNEDPDGTRVTRDNNLTSEITRDEDPDGTRVTRDSSWKSSVVRDESPDGTRVTRRQERE